MTSAADLFGLQEIDLARDSRRALIADIDSRLAEPQELIVARERVQSAEAEIEAIRREQREVEAQLDDLDSKIGTLEKKLYDGSIRNPKELTDLQKEVEHLKQRRRALDEQGLALMERSDEAAAALEKARQQAAELERAWRQDVADLKATQERARREVSQLDEERQRRIQAMERDVLSLYEALRPKKAGRAVARVERGACQGCRLSLPTHVVQRARSAGTIVQCPSCERILVAG
ncbi:MAG TPA: C4-type zinc ribbon domain-containing protein [Dehalococcoidia bacterium]|nr:C4-type zinc ribbon domain-containing protein [Dehalococcoidia bacterium]